MTTFQWANDPNPLSLTTKFIVPDENKPNLTNISHLDSIPTVDMNMDNETLIHDISRACEEYGIFHLINHGIPKELCDKVLQVITDFFHLSYEEKSKMLSKTHMEDGKLFKYFIKDPVTGEKIFMWGEAFFHTWDPVDDSFIQKLPLINDVIHPALRDLSLISVGVHIRLVHGLSSTIKRFRSSRSSNKVFCKLHALEKIIKQDNKHYFQEI